MKIIWNSFRMIDTNVWKVNAIKKCLMWNAFNQWFESIKIYHSYAKRVANISTSSRYHNHYEIHNPFHDCITCFVGVIYCFEFRFILDWLQTIARETSLRCGQTHSLRRDGFLPFTRVIAPKGIWNEFDWISNAVRRLLATSHELLHHFHIHECYYTYMHFCWLLHIKDFVYMFYRQLRVVTFKFDRSTFFNNLRFLKRTIQT